MPPRAARPGYLPVPATAAAAPPGPPNPVLPAPVLWVPPGDVPPEDWGWRRRRSQTSERGLQVAVVQFQLVGGTGMAEGMKDHSGQPRLFPQLFKLLQDDTILTGPAIGQRHHQVEVLVLVTEKRPKLILGFFPLPQDVGQGLGQPHLADTGIRLGLFQDDSGAGVGEQRREHMVDVLLPQHLNGPLGGPRQLLVDIDIGVVISNILVGDMDIVPGQPQDLTHPQRAGKGQVHSHIELAVRTLVQGGADHNTICSARE